MRADGGGGEQKTSFQGFAMNIFMFPHVPTQDHCHMADITVPDFLQNIMSKGRQVAGQMEENVLAREEGMWFCITTQNFNDCRHSRNFLPCVWVFSICLDSITHRKCSQDIETNEEPHFGKNLKVR